MPCRTPWDPDFDAGHALIDAQHRALLAQCERLADHCGGAGPADDAAFDAGFEQLKRLAREHFEAEAALLEAQGDPDAEGHRIECEEFGYLADEIATTAHFDRLELQRFVAFWCLGHVRSSAQRCRELLAGAATRA